MKHVATIETMGEASERIKVYLCIALSAARDGDMLSVWERLFSHALRGLLAALQPLRPKQSHTFNPMGFKHNNQV